MSTQQLLMPRNLVVSRNGKRIAIAASIAAALFAGGLVGRSTATTTSTLVVRPATALSTVGESSVGDATRAEMFGAMNGLALPATTLVPKDVSSPDAQRRGEVFRAINGLRRWRI